MSVLLMRLAGPMQSWGTQSRFVDRDTGREPSKSGVVGLLCAALGKPREETPGDGFPTLEELSALRLGIRADREGIVAVDYHTAGGGRVPGRKSYGVTKANGRSDTVVSKRYYLADADFLAAIESNDDSLLLRLDAALHNPVWPLFLGRKSFVPGVPVVMPDALLPSGRLIHNNLEDALRTFPWFSRGDLPVSGLRMVIEDNTGAEGGVRNDNPLSFCFSERNYGLRHTRTTYLAAGQVDRKESLLCISQG